jgi:hypothetical protein
MLLGVSMKIGDRVVVTDIYTDSFIGFGTVAEKEPYGGWHVRLDGYDSNLWRPEKSLTPIPVSDIDTALAELTDEDKLQLSMLLTHNKRINNLLRAISGVEPKSRDGVTTGDIIYNRPRQEHGIVVDISEGNYPYLIAFHSLEWCHKGEFIGI